MLEYDPTKRIKLHEALTHRFFNKLLPEQRLGVMATGHSSSNNGSNERERSHSLSR